MKESDDSFLRGLPYVNIFQAFDCVVTKCFWVNLSPGYEDAIQKFKSSYKAVHIKISILFPIFQLLSILVQISVYQMTMK